MFRIQLPNFKKLFDEYFVINLQIAGHKFSISDARAHLIQTFLGHNRSFRKHAGNGPRKHDHSKPLVFLLRVRTNSTFFSQLNICEHLYYSEQRSQNGWAALRAVADVVQLGDCPSVSQSSAASTTTLRSSRPVAVPRWGGGGHRPSKSWPAPPPILAGSIMHEHFLRLFALCWSGAQSA